MSMRRHVGVLVFALAAGCRHDCIAIPGCLPTFAVQVTVTSAATHAPLDGVTVRVNGDSLNVTPCNGTCRIPGDAGQYTLSFIAPGFQRADRTVNVVSGTPRVVSVSGPEGYEGQSCGCATVNTQSLDVALVPGT